LDKQNPINERRGSRDSSDSQMQAYKAAANAAYSYSKQKLIDQKTDLNKQPEGFA
jgi:hypothetical protein